MEKGTKEDLHLSRSIRNLRMRSSYSSGFGISTPSFMAPNRLGSATLDSPTKAKIKKEKEKHKSDRAKGNFILNQT